MDIFDKEYPEISKLYYEYVISEEYGQNILANYISKEISAAIDKAVAQIVKGEQVKAADTVSNICTHSEQAGFILGFKYALELIRETNILKELSRCTR